MIIENADIYGEDHIFHKGSLELRGRKIQRIYPDLLAPAGSREEEVLDASESYVIPGLVDLHFHGAMGMDVCDGSLEAFQTIADYELRHGITSICPATLTLPALELERILRTGADFRDRQIRERSGEKGQGIPKDDAACSDQRSAGNPADQSAAGAELVGFNMEGPFISHVKKGAQNEKYILPCDGAKALRFLEASKGLVKIMGLAPEENPDFETYLKEVRSRVTVALAHTNADYETASAAFEAGASHVVHLFNAMPELLHRAPGVIGAAADHRQVTAEIICDGIHVHPAAVRAAFGMFGKDRLILISDSLRSAGMPDGEYDLGGQRVVKKGRLCTLKEGGSIAGSVSNLMDCLLTAVREMGIPLESAIQCATENPARRLGLSDRIGAIRPGMQADLVLLDKADLTIRAVMKAGQWIATEPVSQSGGMSDGISD